MREPADSADKRFSIVKHDPSVIEILPDLPRRPERAQIDFGTYDCLGMIKLIAKHINRIRSWPQAVIAFCLLHFSDLLDLPGVMHRQSDLFHVFDDRSNRLFQISPAGSEQENVINVSEIVPYVVLTLSAPRFEQLFRCVMVKILKVEIREPWCCICPDRKPGDRIARTLIRIQHVLCHVYMKIQGADRVRILQHTPEFLLQDVQAYVLVKMHDIELHKELRLPVMLNPSFNSCTTIFNPASRDRSDAERMHSSHDDRLQRKDQHPSIQMVRQSRNGKLPVLMSWAVEIFDRQRRRVPRVKTGAQLFGFSPDLVRVDCMAIIGQEPFLYLCQVVLVSRSFDDRQCSSVYILHFLIKVADTFHLFLSSLPFDFLPGSSSRTHFRSFRIHGPCCVGRQMINFL